MYNNETPNFLAECTNSDNGKKDRLGNGCDYYNSICTNEAGCPYDCGNTYDDENFNSIEMCCGCKGAFYIYISTCIRLVLLYVSDQ